MAKSLRSKSQRRNKALLRQTVFKPVEEKRMQRLKEKEVTLITEAKVVECEATRLVKKRVNGRIVKERKPFNFYGLSDKDYVPKKKW